MSSEQGSNLKLVYVKYDENPPKNHMIYAMLDFKERNQIQFRALGKARRTLELYKQRFIEYDIGDIVDEQSGYDHRKQAQYKTFILQAKHNRNHYNDLRCQIRKEIDDDKLYQGAKENVSYENQADYWQNDSQLNSINNQTNEYTWKSQEQNQMFLDLYHQNYLKPNLREILNQQTEMKVSSNMSSNSYVQNQVMNNQNIWSTTNKQDAQQWADQQMIQYQQRVDPRNQYWYKQQHTPFESSTINNNTIPTESKDMDEEMKDESLPQVMNYSLLPPSSYGKGCFLHENQCKCMEIESVDPDMKMYEHDYFENHMIPPKMLR